MDHADSSDETPITTTDTVSNDHSNIIIIRHTNGTSSTHIIVSNSNGTNSTNSSEPTNETDISERDFKDIE